MKKKPKNPSGPKRVRLPSEYAWKEARYGNLFRVVDGRLMVKISQAFADANPAGIYAVGEWDVSTLDNQHGRAGYDLAQWEAYAAAAEAVREWQERQ